MKALRSLIALGSRARAAPVDDRLPGDVACRNCGTDAPGAYCPSCGQETTLRMPKATTFLREAAGRYVAFDGRMWRTLFALAFRPGFLTREYLAGRRKRYVRPSRLVLVLAIVLFAVARFLAEPDGMVRIGAETPTDAGTKGAVVQMDNEPVTIVVGASGLTFDPALNVSLTGTGVLGERFERHVAAFNKLDRDQKVREIVNGMLRFGPYALIALWAVAWLFWSMHAVYGGRWSGTIVRGLVVTTVYAVLFVVAVLGLLVAAILFR